MNEWCYHYAGVAVASQIELPEWTNFIRAPTSQPADVVIMRRAPLSNPDGSADLLVAGAAGLTFGLPKIGRYNIRAGREIVMTPYRGADEDDLRHFLLGSAWGALGYQRGWFPLHASVVQMGEGAVALCAPTGNGKSSLAAWLMQQGYPLFSDDLCRLDVVRDQTPRVWRSAPHLKLQPDARLALEWQDQPLMRDQLQQDKFLLPFPPPLDQKTTQALPLRAIYVLDWGELSLRPFPSLQAIRSILTTATYRPEFVKVLGQTAAYWQRVIELVNQTPIFHLRRPRDWEAMPTVGRMLIEHVETIPSTTL